MSPERQYGKPASLKTGDKVAIVNPLSVVPHRFRKQIAYSTEYLEQKGFVVVDRSSQDEQQFQRMTEFNTVLSDGSIKGIFPLTGNRFGEEVIEDVAYENLLKNRPVFTSFSAASSMLLAIHERGELVTFYGPHITFVNSRASYQENTFSTASFWNMLTKRSGKHGLGSKLGYYAFRWRDNNLELRNIFSGDIDKYDERIPFIGLSQHTVEPVATGQLLPSFLQGLESAIDIGIDICFENKIVIVESNETSFEEAFEILSRIEKKKMLSNSQAVILASFVSRRDRPNPQLERELYNQGEVVKFRDKVSDLLKGNVPVIYGFPMGHSRYKLTVPMGVSADVNLETGDIVLNESPFED